MAIELQCPTCGKVLTLRDELAGRKGRCPQCKSVIVVPGGEATPAPEPVRETAADVGTQTTPSVVPLSSGASGAPQEDWIHVFEDERPLLKQLRGGPSRASGPAEKVPDYAVLKFYAQLLKGLAVVVAIVAVVVVAAMSRERADGSGILVVIGGGLLVILSLLVTGEAVSAFRDIAINSWHLRRK